MKPSYCIVVLATIYQVISLVFILGSPIPIRVASSGLFYQLFNPSWIGGILLLISILLAIYGLFAHIKYRFIFFMPQYFFLLLDAGSSMYFITQSHYADGVMRSWQFIFRDQVPYLIIAVMYIFSIIDFRKVKYDE